MLNKKQIQAELRRSACFDVSPFFRVSEEVYEYLYEEWYDFLYPNPNDTRTFFLLVAEAIE